VISHGDERQEGCCERGRKGESRARSAGASAAFTYAIIKLQVVVRCRPLSTKELQDGRGKLVQMDVGKGEVAVSAEHAREQRGIAASSL
jgi:hypothetical protein